MARVLQKILFKRGKKSALTAKLVGDNRPALGEPIFEAGSELEVSKPLLKIGDGIHDYADLEYVGYEVIANPDETATATLSKIKIEGVVYELKGGTEVTVDEDSFIFKNNLTTMYDVGKVEASVDNPVTIDAKGKSFKEVWNSLFVNVIDPVVTQPSWTVVYSDSDVTGAVIEHPTATLTLNPGSYSYGPATNVTATALSVDGTTVEVADNTGSTTLSEITVPATYTGTATYSYSGASTPVNNIGEDVESLKIADVTDATLALSHTFASTGTLTVNKPTVSTSVTTVGSYEAGETVSPNYTISLSYATGNYPYGSTTTTDKSANLTTALTKSVNGGAYEDTTTGTFSFGTITVTDAKQTVTIAASAAYNASDRIPVSSKGNKVPSKQITAGTSTSSKTCTIPAGYRQIFWGYSTTDEITSAVIRALANKKQNAALSSELLDEDTTAKCIIIAAPTGTRTLSKVTMPSSSEADVTTQFVKQSATIDVEGANGYTAKAYDIWLYEPAAMAGTYKITMN